MPKLSLSDTTNVLKMICEAIIALRIKSPSLQDRTSNAAQDILSGGIAALEAQAIKAIKSSSSVDPKVLAYVLMANSRAMLRAMPSHATLDVPLFRYTARDILRWMEPEDLAEAVRCGLGFAESLEEFLLRAESDRDIRDIIINTMAPRSLAVTTNGTPLWLCRSTFASGPTNLVSDVFQIQAKSFKAEIEKHLKSALHKLDPLHAKALFYAGIEFPALANLRFVAPETQEFSDSVSSNHGRMTALAVPQDVSDLVTQIAQTVPPF